MKKRKKKKIGILEISSCILCVVLLVFTWLMFKGVGNVENIYPEFVKYGKVAFIVLDVIALFTLVSSFTLSKNKGYKILTVLLEVILIASTVVGIYVLKNQNNEINKIFEGNEYQESHSVSFVTKKSLNHSSLTDLSRNVLVGYINSDDSIDGNKVALEAINKNNITSELVGYDTYVDMIMGLIREKVDVIILPSNYQDSLKNDDVVGYYLNDLKTIYTYDTNITLNINTGSDIDVTKDSFLLLFSSRSNDISTSLMLLSVNPNTLTVTVTSIPLNSYAAIKSSGNDLDDRIGYARSLGIESLVKTVENIYNLDIEFYIDIDEKGIEGIVDNLGGVDVNLGKAVLEFDDGLNTLSGSDILKIAHERDSLTKGYIDQLDNQRTLLLSILRDLIEDNNLTSLLNILKVEEGSIRTNLSVNQIKDFYEMYKDDSKNKEVVKILSCKSFIVTPSRLTGYSEEFYSYDYEMPVSIFKIYKGSVSDDYNLICENLYLDVDDLNDYETYLGNNGYYIHNYKIVEKYNEQQDKSIMPEYTPQFIGNYTPKEVSEWCEKNGKTIKVNEVNEGSVYYDSSKEHNSIVAQSPTYGKLLSQYEQVEIWVIKKSIDCTLAENKVYEECQDGSYLPNFKGMTLEQVNAWLNLVDAKDRPNVEVTYLDYQKELGYVPDKVVGQKESANTPVYLVDTIHIYISRYPWSTLAVTDLKTMTKTEALAWFKENWSSDPIIEYSYDATKKENEVVYVYKGSSNLTADTMLRTNDVITLHINGVYLKEMVGMTLGEAKNHFKQLGITTDLDSHITYIDTDDETLDKTVAAQNMTYNSFYTPTAIAGLQIEVYKYKEEIVEG